ncbi:Homeodomain-like protein [Phycomyces nitens]|nr:Homeodomain-like protein [Phycomyces nitens]
MSTPFYPVTNIDWSITNDQHSNTMPNITQNTFLPDISIANELDSMPLSVMDYDIQSDLNYGGLSAAAYQDMDPSIDPLSLAPSFVASLDTSPNPQYSTWCDENMSQYAPVSHQPLPYMVYSPVTVHKNPKRSKRPTTYSRWTPEEDEILRHAIAIHGPARWSLVATHIPNRSPMQCSTRWMGALNPHIHKGRWTDYEDSILRYSVQEFANFVDHEGRSMPMPWNKIAERIPNRTGIQCQARWTEALDPTVRKGKWTAEEDVLLRLGVVELGRSWIRIAETIEGRTQRQCRTRWMQIKYKEDRQALGKLADNTEKTPETTNQDDGSSVSCASTEEYALEDSDWTSRRPSSDQKNIFVVDDFDTKLPFYTQPDPLLSFIAQDQNNNNNNNDWSMACPDKQEYPRIYQHQQ